MAALTRVIPRLLSYNYSLPKRNGISAKPYFIYLTSIHQLRCKLLQINLFHTSLPLLKEVVEGGLGGDPYRRQVVLGIETSCDDTGAAVVADSGEVLGEALHNQQSVHLRHGGIIPPVAQRLHEQNIEQVVNEALEKAGMTVRDLDAIAATVKPGLSLSLSVGTRYGKNLAVSGKKPFIPIHHMEAHALTVRMVHKAEFPFLVLLASGGHSLLVIAHSLDHWSIIGQTIDDAPGEALDQGARRLKLRNIPECASMSGGQAIEYLATGGNPRAYEFPTPMGKYKDCTFSFSGLKHTLTRLIERLEEEYEVEGGNIIPPIQDVCASFQYAVTKHLVRQTQRAMVYLDVRDLLPSQNKTLVVSGGVACNQYIRAALQKLCDTTGYQLLCPPPKLCTDNGIMIAWNGMERWLAKAGVLHDEEDIAAVDFQARCPIGEDLTNDVRSLRIQAQKWVKF
ncbi:probable tRNA N6-adenosine threonylcarbamoyltransferase, mitochondrial isoform X2 [Homarus americanus]|uniref:tRNA N6-adenosine threonylcarbamoyltransferase-like n=1 Tax=Homarus americanus TaxID=6706 RepID=A0A8J5TKG5_HOMAM|nr:probable tRNA N6-adenosine threonylcarbamoyltransferase, mitochondrial isoform X2 [Homarus americanus]KAG7176235.1 tRNA N6-adenosine threonylcarbamoyltransferase-like [Homarus americanus]